MLGSSSARFQGVTKFIVRKLTLQPYRVDCDVVAEMSLVL